MAQKKLMTWYIFTSGKFQERREPVGNVDYLVVNAKIINWKYLIVIF
jgi:hypothetical protein